ncbi:MAG: HAMP domain-containing protein [Desulfobacterales bacterium]|nr:HAMP domain-containing protein [Desulfobacterales bacterium]MBF0396397.1 HAMP domain-containing protein [Desulfobacterales bacterium]
MKNKRKLFWQIYPSYFFIILVSMIALAVHSSIVIHDFFLNQTIFSLEEKGKIVEHQFLQHFSPLNKEAIRNLCIEIGKKSSTRITIIIPSGEVVGDSIEPVEKMDNHINRPEIIEALNRKLGSAIRYSSTLKSDLMYVAVPLLKDGKIVGFLRTSLPINYISKALTSLQKNIMIWGFFIVFFAGIISLIISRYISHPLEEMKEGAKRFADGDLKYKLSLPKTEELSSLASTMNMMAKELDDRMNTVIRNQNELKAVLASMTEGVIAVDMDEKIININNEASHMFDINLSKSANLSIYEVIRNVDLQTFVKDVLFAGTFKEKDIRSEKSILNARCTPICDSSANRIGALIVLNDVTQMRQLETMRKDFVANVSHELKTPLTAIKGFVETLKECFKEDLEQAEYFLEIIEKHVNRLNAIIDDLLNLSKIELEDERKKIKFTQTQLLSVLKEAIQICEAKAIDKKIKINLVCDKNIFVKIDSCLMEQAFINLIDNAIKYNNGEGIIEVCVKYENGELIISIKDQGIGIPKEHLPRIFERFYRVDKARSRKLGGTGLGLSIVKHIVIAHGGQIKVASELNKGSIFTIYLKYN